MPRYGSTAAVGDSSRPELRVVPISDGRTWSALQRCLGPERSDWLGQGKDQASQHDRPYSKLELVQAWRVEHPLLWAKYQVEKGKMRADIEAQSIPLPPIEIRPALAEATSGLPGHCDDTVRERYLLHGTRPELVLSIMRDGLNERFTSRAFFGFGAYLCEDACKADQYVMPEFVDARNLSSELHQVLFADAEQWPYPRGRVYYTFLCRVALGHCARRAA
mmetsp:Transcript_45254/g.145037  ORF Transcript_45254/g.145037 Transcript_45254/m.145037 type:complete len:220 (-) Transcript_45254:133-792(-)